MEQKIKLKPYTLVIRTTERCNVGCFHCSISATTKGNDLPLEKGMQAIREAKANGLNRVHFTGGEPLLYDSLLNLVNLTKELNMFSDVTSSTFTKSGEETLQLLDKLNKAGLECVMLSYDEPHSKKVSIEQFTSFAKQSQNLGMHICVFVTEGGNTTFKTGDLKTEFIKENINIDKIEWTVSEYQYVGRGEKFLSLAREEEEEHYCRCPYVMAVPTLTPNGDILLCHMSRFKTKNFVVGNYPEESLETILDRMENTPMYRYLSKYGPQQSLRNLGFEKTEVPNDMCMACEKYLKKLEEVEYQNELNQLLLNDDLSEIAVDLKAVLPIYQRYLSEYGEKIIANNDCN
jgi:MoaA/NifB/PqqE/SkfB family radical SAM enzyme